MPENKLQALHTNLSKLNPEFKVPLDQFEKDMQDETKLQTLHGNLAKQHEDFKVPFDQFKSDMWSTRPATQPLPAAQAAPEIPAAAPSASATPVAEPTNTPQLSFQSKGFEMPGTMDKILPTEKTSMEKYVQPAVEQADVTQVQQDPKLTKVDTLKAEYLTKTRGADYASKWAEEAAKTGSFADEAGARLMRAGTEFNQMLVNAPNTLLRMVNALPNELYKAVGLPEVSGDSFNKLTGLDKNVASLEQTKEALSQKILKLNPDAEASLVESLGKGDFGTFGRNIAGSVLEALPLSISLMTATPAVGSSAVTAAGAVLFGGQKMKELDEKAPNMPEGIKSLVGATNGALEGWFESTFGSGAVSSAMMKLIANEGKTAAKETIKGGLREGFTALLTKYPALAPLGEFYEEFATQTAQNYVDILAGIKPMESLFEGSLDNGLVGLASGGLHTAPLSLVKSYERNKAKQAFSDNREQATRTIQQNFDALKQPDGNLHTGFDKEGMEVVITSTTPGGMAVLHDGRIVDISDIQDVQVHPFEALFGQQMAEFDATNDPDLQVQQPQVQSTFNWNGRNMQLTDVSDKDELLAQEIDAEGEPVGRPESISMEEYRKVVEQQVAAPEATPELRTYDIAGAQVPFTPQGDGSYLGEEMKTPEEAQTALEELTKQIGAENAIEVKTVPGADNLTPATYQLSVRPKTPEESAAPAAEEVSPLDQLIPKGEAKQYTLNDQPIERGKALARVKAAIFANDRKKIEGLDVTGDEELTKMLEKAFPVKITIGKKKASTEDALNWIDAADTIEELRMLTIEGAAPTNDVKNAYALKVKELTPEVSPEEVTKLTEGLFTQEPAAEVVEPDITEQLFEQPTNTKQDDNRNVTGLPGSEQGRETAEQAGSIEAGGRGEAAASGNVQGDGQGLTEEREGGPSGSTEVRAEDQGTPATAKAARVKPKKKPSPSKLADLYKTRLTKLKQDNPKTYWSVDLPSDADLLEAAKEGRLVDMNGGMAYVTKDGDLKGLFKYDPAAKGTAKALQAERIKMGGIKLDAYDTEGTGEVSLVPTYKKNGFREVARVDFNPEFAPTDMPESVKAMNPDVVVMVYDPEGKLPIKERRFNKEQYEDALEYRDSYITEEPIPDHNKSGDTHDFFSDVVTGTSDKYKPRRKWEPLMEFSPKEEAVRPTFEKFNGNFDEHIATSIPGFRDIQIKVVSAINEMLKGKDALIYDIGGSEGGFVKTITELSDGRVKSINLDANGEMEAVHNATPVEGSTFVKEAFGPGFEWDGVEYPQHEPKQKADVVHESMTFQFIDEKRGDKLDELVEKYIKPDGIFITEEKIHPASRKQWAANEAKKDADFKLKYYDQDQISAKRDEVLTGMVTNQTTYARYKNELMKRFDFVEEYWDSGNFKGLVASNDKAKVDKFLANVGNTDTEFSEKNINPEKPTFKKKPFSLLSMVDKAAAQTDTNPSEAQVEAGNYKKGHVTVQGMDISIENPKGSVRSGTDEDGKAWETEMKAHYGYFKGTVGRDGDHVDVFIGENPESQTIFVVDQNFTDSGEFDESKVMLGYNSIEEAKAAYLAHYEPGWEGLRDITSVGIEAFKKWLYDGARQRKPFGEYVGDKPKFRIKPEQAKELPYKTELPTSDTFKAAVENTEGVRITEDGLIMKVVRFQKEEMEGSTAIRTGVFYLPEGDANVKYYRNSKTGYGGKVKQEGETLIKRPIFVKGATGGKAPEAAYDQIKGKGAAKQLAEDMFSSGILGGYRRRIEPSEIYNFLEERGSDGNIAWEMVEVSKEGNTLRYAIQENIIAHAVRGAGYDAVIGYSTKRDGTPFISEIFDVRETTYPSGEFDSDIHDAFLKREQSSIRFQAKKLYAGLETVPKFKDLTELTAWLQKWGKKNKVFASEEAKLDDDKFVKGLVKHTIEELAAFEELSDYPYLGFYDYDIPTRLNPELQKFAEKRYGYELSASQMALYHLVSGFASPSADPVMDSSKGLDVFDRYMRTGELTSASDKPATVWSMNEMGKKVDTGVPKLDAEGNPVYSQVTVAYATTSLNKFRDNVLKHFKGDINKAIEWISTRHSYEEISKMMGAPVKGKGSLDVHEYLTKEDGGFGIFGFTGAKLGSYVLNRIGNFSTVTKDLWYARTMARLTGEALQEKTGEALKLPWAITAEGRRKRALADKAWGIVADKLGITPADVQQKMWEFEKRLYEKIGAKGSSGTTGYASEGFLKRAKELEPELYEPFTPAKPAYKKKPVSVSGANAALKAVIENWENAALVQTPITLATEVEATDLLRGRIDPAFEKQIRETGFYGLYADGEIFLDPAMDDSSALITWIHEKSHIAITSSFKTEAAKRSYLEKLYDYIGISEFRRVVPVEYWFDAKDVKAEEYLTHLAEDIILQEGKLEGAPEFAKNLIFGHVESFIPIKYLQDEKQRLDQTARGQNAGEADNGRAPEIAGNRPGEEGVGDGSLRPDEGGTEVDIWEQLFEGVPAYKLKEETINVDGVDRPVLNSKGLPIHPTAEGVKNFWKWFGDSKVVDKQGRPLVVYHRTYRNFEAFEKKRLSEFYFSTSPELYANYGNIEIAAYIKINNPAYSVNKNGVFIGEEYDGAILKFDNFGEKETRVIAKSANQIKSATGNLGGFDPTDPRISYRRKPAAVVDKKQVQTTGEKIQEILINNKLALKNWMEDIQTIVPAIQDYENPLLKDALAKSKVTTKLHNFENNQYKRLIASIAEVLRTSGITKEELSHYLIAVHGVERNQKFWNAEPLRVGEDFSGLSELKKTVRDAADPAEQLKIDGMNNEAFAEYYQKQIEAKLSPRQVKELWDSIRDISKVTLDELLDAGMISKAYYDELRQMYKNYIPLRAWEDSNPEEFEFGQGVGSYNAPIIQAKGRKSLAEDPLATLLQMANTAYISGERNRVKIAAGELVRNNDKALKDFAQYKRTYFVNQGTDAQGLPIIQETIDRPDQALFDQGLVTTKVPKEYTARKTSAQAKEFEVEFFRNGNKYVLVFQGSDPAVARAINNKEASLGLDYLNKVTSAPIKLGKVEIPSISGMSRYLSAINTTYSVDFPLVNFLRDAPMAILSEYIYGDAKEAFRMFPFTKDAETAMRRKLQGKQDLTNPIDQQLEDFFNFGGPTGFAFLKNVEEFKASVKRDVRRINDIKNPLVRMESGFAHGLKLISQLSEWSETITRFAGYLNHIQQGDSKEKAALAAKNLTVNFDQKGRLSPTLNGLYTFFNAAIQAVDKYFKLWGRNWKKMAAIHMFLTVQGFLNAMLLDLFGGEDDEKVKNYDKVSDYTKKNNLVIPIPGTNETFSFPVPQILRKFHAMGFDAYDLMSGKKQVQEVLLGQLSSIPSDISPIDTESFLNGEGDLSIKPLVPSILKPLVELEANENFMKLPISPEPFSLDLARKIADTRRVYKDVNQIAQYVTDKMYELGGGDETGFKYVYDDGELKSIPALLDVSPESIEHLFESYFGGVGKLVNRTGKTTSDVYSFGKKLVDGGEFKEAIKEINVNVIPVANRFIRTPMGDPLQKEFRKVRNDFENKLKVLKQAEKDKDFEKFNTIYMQIGGKLEQYKAIMTTFEKLDEERLKLEKVSPEDAKEVNKIAREQMQEIIKLK